MLKPEQVPDEVVEAFVDAFHGKDMTRKAAIAAALSAWPGMEIDRLGGDMCIILGLPQENENG